MKTLFHFRGQEISLEIFEETHEKALAEIERIMGKNITTLKLVFITQNIDCPKCSCHATECNYGEA